MIIITLEILLHMISKKIICREILKKKLQKKWKSVYCIELIINNIITINIKLSLHMISTTFSEGIFQWKSEKKWKSAYCIELIINEIIIIINLKISLHYLHMISTTFFGGRFW